MASVANIMLKISGIDKPNLENLLRYLYKAVGYRYGYVSKGFEMVDREGGEQIYSLVELTLCERHRVLVSDQDHVKGIIQGYLFALNTDIYKFEWR